MTPEQKSKMDALNELARKRGRVLAFKCMGMLMFVAIVTVIIDTIFTQSSAFVFFANLAGGILVISDTSANMKHEVALLEEEAKKILDDK